MTSLSRELDLLLPKSELRLLLAETEFGVSPGKVSGINVAHLLAWILSYSQIPLQTKQAINSCSKVWKGTGKIFARPLSTIRT